MSVYSRALLRSLQNARGSSSADGLPDRIRASEVGDVKNTYPEAPFYLLSERVLLDNPPKQKRMQGVQMRKYLENAGVKPEEFAFTALGDYLSNAKSVTADDVLRQLRENMPAAREDLYTNTYMDEHGYEYSHSANPSYEEYTGPGAEDSYEVRSFNYPLATDQRDIRQQPAHFTGLQNANTPNASGEIMHTRTKDRGMRNIEEIQSDPHKAVNDVRSFPKLEAEQGALQEQIDALQEGVGIAQDRTRRLGNPPIGLPDPLRNQRRDLYTQAATESSELNDQALELAKQRGAIDDRMGRIRRDTGSYLGGALPTEDRGALREDVAKAQGDVDYYKNRMEEYREQRRLDRTDGLLDMSAGESSISEAFDGVTVDTPTEEVERRVEAFLTTQKEDFWTPEMREWQRGEEEAKARLRTAQERLDRQIPNLPFEKTYPALAFKREMAGNVMGDADYQNAASYNPGWMNYMLYHEEGRGRGAANVNVTLDSDGDFNYYATDEDGNELDSGYFTDPYDLPAGVDVDPNELQQMRDSYTITPYEDEIELDATMLTVNAPGGSNLGIFTYADAGPNATDIQDMEESVDAISAYITDDRPNYSPELWRRQGADLYYGSDMVTDLPQTDDASQLADDLLAQLRDGSITPDNAGDLSAISESDYVYENRWVVSDDDDYESFETEDEAIEAAQDMMRRNIENGYVEGVYGSYTGGGAGDWELPDDLDAPKKLAGFENVYDQRYKNVINRKLKQDRTAINKVRQAQGLPPLSELQLPSEASYELDFNGNIQPVHGVDIPEDWTADIKRNGLPFFVTAAGAVLTGAMLTPEQAQANVPEVPGDEGYQGALDMLRSERGLPGYVNEVTNRAKQVGGVLENVAGLGLSAGAEAASGLGMLAQGAMPGVDMNTALPDQMQQLVGQIPRSQVADQQMQAVGTKLVELAQQYPQIAALLKSVMDPDTAGDNIMEMTGSPALSAIGAGAAGAW